MASHPPVKLAKGVHFDPAADKYFVQVPKLEMFDPATGAGTTAKGFALFFEDAGQATSAYDCVQLLMHGPFACTTSLPYGSQTQACLQAVAKKMRDAGMDVCATITGVQVNKGPCAWARISPGAAPGEWVAPIAWDGPAAGQGNKPWVIRSTIGPFQDPRAAARAADAALLVLEGPSEGRHPCLNFPLASYSEEEIQAARDALVAVVATERLSGERKQHAAILLAGFDKHIRAVNQVGSALGVAVGLGGDVTAAVSAYIVEWVLRQMCAVAFWSCAPRVAVCCWRLHAC
jgi:hypothetical protein